MKKALKVVGIIAAVVVLIFAIGCGLILYGLYLKPSAVDSAESHDGKYEMELDEIGSALFFSPTNVRVTLKEGGRKISSSKHGMANDGASLSENNWEVRWYDDRAEVILDGAEQDPEKLTYYYSGKISPNHQCGDPGGSDDHMKGEDHQ